MSEIIDLTKNGISNCNLRQHAIFLQLYLCARANCQHCDEQQFHTLMCTLHDFLSSKVRFIHTSTATRLEIRLWKKLRTRLAYILFYVFHMVTCHLS